jgi:hypothetical protein
MDHSSAIENHTAARYLMDELSESERNAYEEHFFSCPECAEEIKSASEFMESARKVVQQELKLQSYSQTLRRSSARKWLNWGSMLQPVPAFAGAMLIAVAGFAGYQSRVTIPRLSQMAEAHLIPQNTVRIALTQSRGEPIAVPAGKPLSLIFAVPKTDDSSLSFSSYEADIVSARDVTKFSFNISQQQAQDPIQVFLAAAALPPGKYEVVVRGIRSSGAQPGTKTELERLPFAVTAQN